MHSLVYSLSVAVLACGACYFLFRRSWLKRLDALECGLQALSDEVCQMAEAQIKSHQRLSGSLSEIEERILELAVPSEDANLAVQRRRRVLALASQGTPVEEIAKRASVPRGEAELIMNLQRFRGSAAPQGQGQRER